eukprot:TRINITY_DN24884_c0_g1_i1.p1 TRINITY_DN24884_c0_g1~~TRINITY_DN24884_c0_g1_i1.p1  ORF type:complete len:560 (+),score=175.36 TRINITY_DN24884_c0_g1_i1:81-1760(+)
MGPMRLPLGAEVDAFRFYAGACAPPEPAAAPAPAPAAPAAAPAAAEPGQAAAARAAAEPAPPRRPSWAEIARAPPKPQHRPAPKPQPAGSPRNRDRPPPPPAAPSAPTAAAPPRPPPSVADLSALWAQGREAEFSAAKSAALAQATALDRGGPPQLSGAALADALGELWAYHKRRELPEPDYRDAIATLTGSRLPTPEALVQVTADLWGMHRDDCLSAADFELLKKDVTAALAAAAPRPAGAEQAARAIAELWGMHGAGLISAEVFLQLKSDLLRVAGVTAGTPSATTEQSIGALRQLELACQRGDIDEECFWRGKDELMRFWPRPQPAPAAHQAHRGLRRWRYSPRAAAKGGATACQSIESPKPNAEVRGEASSEAGALRRELQRVRADIAAAEAALSARKAELAELRRAAAGRPGGTAEGTARAQGAAAVGALRGLWARRQRGALSEAQWRAQKSAVIARCLAAAPVPRDAAGALAARNGAAAAAQQPLAREAAARAAARNNAAARHNAGAASAQPRGAAAVGAVLPALRQLVAKRRSAQISEAQFQSEKRSLLRQF